MDNISIPNSALQPALEPGWELKDKDEPPVLDNHSTASRIEINQITLMILGYCDGQRDVTQIVEALCAQFPDASDAIPGDVEDVLQQLQQQGAIGFAPTTVQQVFDVPEKSPPSAHKKKLCIGMATYDDYDGVYFSVQAIRLYHPEILDQLEIVIIDNHPDGPCGQALKSLGNWIPRYRYIPTDDIRGTAVRDVIFREANADYVLCMDSHVMIEAGAISRLLAHFDAFPDSMDLLQGPLLNDDLVNISTHFSDQWRDGMYGTWGHDKRGDDPDNEAFDIPMQGLGLFACRKSAWPGFNPRFSGFGGEEGYIHEKFRQAGGRTLCLPFLRWIHRFVRPLGTRYEVKWEDRIRNYMIGFDELGLDTTELVNHFETHIGEQTTSKILEAVRAELADPLFGFDALVCVYDELEDLPAVYGALEGHIALKRMEYAAVAEFEDEELDGAVLAYQHSLDKALVGGKRRLLIINAKQLNDPGAAKDLHGLIEHLTQPDWRAILQHKQGEVSVLSSEQSLPKLAELSKMGVVACRRTAFQSLMTT